MATPKRFLLAIASAACLVSGACAAGPAIPDSAVRQLAQDLDELQAKAIAAQRQTHLEKLAGDPNAWLAHPKQVVVTAQTARIFAGASNATRVLMSARQGTPYPIVDKAGDWYAVALDVATLGREAGTMGADAGSKGLVSGWINAKDVAPRFDYTMDKLETDLGHRTPLSGTPSSGSVYQALAESATALRAKYQNNPYFSVTGFQVTTTPPGLTLTFEFNR